MRPEATLDRTYATKFAASHYLSLNVTNKWNIGLFESVVWANNNNRGFDMSFVNPLIFIVRLSLPLPPEAEMLCWE